MKMAWACENRAPGFGWDGEDDHTFFEAEGGKLSDPTIVAALDKAATESSCFCGGKVEREKEVR